MTGTWLDEIVEVGVPLALFIGLWVWSTRKEKQKAKTQATSKSAPNDARTAERAETRRAR